MSPPVRLEQPWVCSRWAPGVSLAELVLGLAMAPTWAERCWVQGLDVPVDSSGLPAHDPVRWRGLLVAAIFTSVMFAAFVTVVLGWYPGVLLPLFVPLGFLAGYQYRAVCARERRLPPRRVMWMMRLVGDGPERPDGDTEARGDAGG